MKNKIIDKFSFLVKSFYHTVKVKESNCLPICPHCEVDVSEKTAKAISDLIGVRIKEYRHPQFSSNIIDELKLIQKRIKNGDWHEIYETLEK